MEISVLKTVSNHNVRYVSSEAVARQNLFDGLNQLCVWRHAEKIQILPFVTS